MYKYIYILYIITCILSTSDQIKEIWQIIALIAITAPSQSLKKAQILKSKNPVDFRNQHTFKQSIN